ncbi:hypothetical protein V499_04984 [Pseudogymnoascus sp. VKM F-103]|nr:hypothetical protein V499_04984 [Pseudogymnoascus sp. VKM F-103]
MTIHCKTRKLVSNTLSSKSPDLGPCSIEQYVAKKARFRVAPTNRIPVSWPHDDKTHRPSTDRYGVFDNDLEEITKDALEKFGIEYRSAAVKKLTPQGFPAAEERTVIILTRETETDTTRWQEAVDYINEIIKDAAAQAGKKMDVELENYFESYYDISSAIRPGTSIHKSFLQIEHVVETEVRRSCSGLWTSIAYHNRRHKFADSINVGFLSLTGVVEQPTVIVFVTPGSMAHWGEVEAQICQAIEAAPFEEDVEIALEILPGFNVPSIGPSAAYTPTTSKHPRYLDIEPVPTLGASIGPQLSDTDSGSLGAVVNFQPRGGGEPRKCFLTSYRAVAPGDPIGRAVNDGLGIGLDGRSVVRQRIEILYPACCDSEYTKDLLAKFAKENTSPKRSHYANLVALIELEGVIGEVIHASGLRQSGSADRRHRMDWALVALHPSKDAVLNIPPDDSKFYRPISRGVESIFSYRAEPDDVISRTGDPVAFSWAGKFHIGPWGTAGRVNSMERTVCWGDGMVSKEIEVIPIDIEFAQGGDDGSMVFNAKKEWVGMVVGSDSEYAGYITPTADIIADIEARTGGTITLV